MKIATFDVDGVGGGLPRLMEWLEEAQPDLVCLQELKTTDEKFPRGKPRGLWVDYARQAPRHPSPLPGRDDLHLLEFLAERVGKEWGLRIDHFPSLVAAKRLRDAGPDRDMRRKEGANAHASTWVTICDNHPRDLADAAGRSTRLPMALIA
ncbi:MAG: exodeoxyribonuclease [Alphaproteobacteria bacterium]|nr:exodeoxyribonuclease [Alphaproteobacteria bacterium]